MIDRHVRSSLLQRLLGNKNQTKQKLYQSCIPTNKISTYEVPLNILPNFLIFKFTALLNVQIYTELVALKTIIDCKAKKY